MASEEAENLFQRTVDTSIESRPPNFQTDDFLQKFLQLRDRFSNDLFHFSLNRS